MVRQKKLYFFLCSLGVMPVSACATQPPIKNELNSQLRSFWFNAQNGTAYALAELLARGADPNYIVDRDHQETLLDKLAYNDEYSEHVKVLIANKATINKPADFVRHSSPLHHTAVGGAPQNARALLRAGAQIDAFTTFYSTPLHLLILYAESAKNSEKRNPIEWPLYLETAQVLVDHGARLDVASRGDKPRQTQSPIMLAIRNGLPEFVTIFRKKIAATDYKKLHEVSVSNVTYISLLRMIC